MVTPPPSLSQLALEVLVGAPSEASLIGMAASVLPPVLFFAFAAPRWSTARLAGGATAMAVVLAGLSTMLAAMGEFSLPALPGLAVLIAGLLGRQAPVRKPARAEASKPPAPATRSAVKPSSPPKVRRVEPEPDVFQRQIQADREAAAQPGAKADRAALGRYRIDRELGRGSMGAVYLGYDPKLTRQVAIKTMALAQEFGGDELAEARTRFFREAETAGRLQHPGIVAIFDAGEEGDLDYIAMEFVRGHDLQRYTKGGSLLPVSHVLHIVAAVADALAYAHQKNVVHRDIKPANVMVDLREDGSLVEGSVKVTDFGIARVTDAARTRTGLVLGTPSFMSPEQMAGRPVDGRSDLYSLGVMLFQLLTGTLPHRAESMAKLMAQIANDRAPDIRSIRPDLPEKMANIVALALEKRPEVRYADGREFAADLRAMEALLDPAAVAPILPAAASKDKPGVNTRELAAVTPEPDGFEATMKISRDD